MNNHCHFYNLGGTEVGNLMGDSWLRAHEQYKDYYAALYLKNSWEKLLPILKVQKDLLSSSVTSQDLVQRLKAFNLAFDESIRSNPIGQSLMSHEGKYMQAFGGRHCTNYKPM
ncbi:Exocyst complex component Exo70 [Sesbania bispinosa]|nr:Exocyst complex component Exo70 [Sesbania bispinosa]